MALPSNLSIVAKASRPKIDDTLLNRDISDILQACIHQRLNKIRNHTKTLRSAAIVLAP